MKGDAINPTEFINVPTDTIGSIEKNVYHKDPTYNDRMALFFDDKP